MHDFVKFYFKFKELVFLQRELNFGNNTHIPEVFSENLVKYLAEYDDWEGKDFDARTKDNLGVEIKATSSKSGITSINVEALTKPEFSHIEWIYIDSTMDEITIKKINKDSLSEFIESKKEGEKRSEIKGDATL